MARANAREPGLDAIRVLAATMVFVCHLAYAKLIGPAWLQGGKSGVILFFGLSGFLIYRPFIRGHVDLRAYFVMRAARLVPAYLVALVGLTFLTGDQTFVRNPLTYLTFSQNYRPDLWQGFAGVTWTLVLEVQFYVLAPVIAVLIGRRLWVALPLAFVSFIGAWASVGLTNGTTTLIPSLFPFAFWAFVPGIAVAILIEGGTRLTHPIGLVAGLGLLIYGVAAPFWATLDLATGAAAFLLIGWVVGCEPKFRGAGLVGGAAGISYSVYLWHVDLIGRTGAVGVSIVTTLAVATLIYGSVERPVVQAARRYARSGFPRVAITLRTPRSLPES